MLECGPVQKNINGRISRTCHAWMSVQKASESVEQESKMKWERVDRREMMVFESWDARFARREMAWSVYWKMSVASAGNE